MLKIILNINFLFLFSLSYQLTQAQTTTPKPVALFLDCNIGTHYSNAIAPIMRQRNEELIVVKCKDFYKKMDELAKKNVYVKTLLASGHDGDGTVYSDGVGEDKGQFNPSEDIEKINSKYPQLFRQTQSYYPLGCYTTSPSNLEGYINVLPNLKFVAGFYGAASSAHRKVAQNYLVEVLSNEKKIIESSQISQFKNIINRFGSMRTGLNMGMYKAYKCDLSLNGNVSKKLNGILLEIDHSRDKKTITDFDLKKCLELKPEFDQKLEEYRKYDSGELEIPLDTKSGPVRNLYSFFRQNEYCTQILPGDTIYPDGSSVFSLLFYRNYLKNYAEFFKEEIQDNLKDINSEISKTTNSAETIAYLKSAKTILESMNLANMSNWNIKKIKEVSVELNRLDSVYEQLDPNRIKNLPYVQSINSFTSLIESREAEESWHEFTPGAEIDDPWPRRHRYED